MANRYFVLQNASNAWNATAPTNWGSASNTADNSSVPGSTDDVFFDGVGAGANNSTNTANITIQSLTMTGYSNTFRNNTVLTISGSSLTYSNTMTITYGASAELDFTATSGTTNITTGGNAMGNVRITGVGGTFKLQDNISLTQLFLDGGTFNGNGKNMTMDQFNGDDNGLGGTRSFVQGSGTVTLTGSNERIWFINNSTGFSLTQTSPFICNYSGGVGTRSVTNGTGQAIAIDLNVTAGTDHFSLGTNNPIGSVNFTGFSGTWDNTAGNTIYGSLTVASTTTVGSGTSVVTFGATSGTKTITTAGKTLDFPITFDGVGGTWQLQDACTVGATRTVTLVHGTLDANNQNFTMGIWSSSSANTRSIKMGTGTWNLTATTASTVWNMATSTNATITPSTSTIKISGSTTNTRTFAGGGKTYANIWFSNATALGRLNFTGSNTFSNIKAGTEGNAQTLGFTAATTTSFSSWSVSGVASNLITLASITAAGHTLTKLGGGYICANYLSISRSTFTPSSPVEGYAGGNSTDGGNNAGWSFKNCPAGNFFLCF